MASPDSKDAKAPLGPEKRAYSKYASFTPMAGTPIPRGNNAIGGAAYYKCLWLSIPAHLLVRTGGNEIKGPPITFEFTKDANGRAYERMLSWFQRIEERLNEYDQRPPVSPPPPGKKRKRDQDMGWEEQFVTSPEYKGSAKDQRSWPRTIVLYEIGVDEKLAAAAQGAHGADDEKKHAQQGYIRGVYHPAIDVVRVIRVGLYYYEPLAAYMDQEKGLIDEADGDAPLAGRLGRVVAEMYAQFAEQDSRKHLRSYGMRRSAETPRGAPLYTEMRTFAQFLRECRHYTGSALGGTSRDETIPVDHKTHPASLLDVFSHSRCLANEAARILDGQSRESSYDYYNFPYPDLVWLIRGFGRLRSLKDTIFPWSRVSLRPIGFSTESTKRTVMGLAPVLIAKEIHAQRAALLSHRQRQDKVSKRPKRRKVDHPAPSQFDDKDDKEDKKDAALGPINEPGMENESPLGDDEEKKDSAADEKKQKDADDIEVKEMTILLKIYLLGPDWYNPADDPNHPSKKRKDRPGLIQHGRPVLQDQAEDYKYQRDLFARGARLINECVRIREEVVHPSLTFELLTPPALTFEAIRKMVADGRSGIASRAQTQYRKRVRALDAENSKTAERNRAVAAEEKTKYIKQEIDQLLIDATHNFQAILNGEGELSPCSEAIRAWIQETLKKRGNLNIPRKRFMNSTWSTFAELICSFLIDLEMAYKFGVSHKTGLLMFFSVMYGYTLDINLIHLHIFGDPQTSKSFLLKWLFSVLIPGTWSNLMYMTAKAQATKGDRNDQIVGFEEMPVGLGGGTACHGELSDQASFIKSLMTSGVAAATFMKVDNDGNRTTATEVGLCSTSYIFLSNWPAVEPWTCKAMQSRMACITAESRPGSGMFILSKNMQGVKGSAWDPYVKDITDRLRTMHALIWMIEKLIYCGIFKDVHVIGAQSTILDILRQCSAAGMPAATETRPNLRVLALVKVFAIADAIDRFFGVEQLMGDGFDLFSLAWIEPFLVGRTEHAKLAMELMSFQYEQPSAEKVRLALAELVFPPIFLPSVACMRCGRSDADPRSCPEHSPRPGGDVENRDVYAGDSENDRGPLYTRQISTLFPTPPPTAPSSDKPSKRNRAMSNNSNSSSSLEEYDVVRRLALRVRAHLRGRLSLLEIRGIIESFCGQTHNLHNPSDFQVDEQLPLHERGAYSETMTITHETITCSRMWIDRAGETSQLFTIIEKTLSHKFARADQSFLRARIKEAESSWVFEHVQLKPDPKQEIKFVNPYQMRPSVQIVLASRIVNDSYSVTDIAQDEAVIVPTSHPDEFFWPRAMKSKGIDIAEIDAYLHKGLMGQTTPLRSAAYWKDRKDPNMEYADLAWDASDMTTIGHGGRSMARSESLPSERRSESKSKSKSRIATPQLSRSSSSMDSKHSSASSSTIALASAQAVAAAEAVRAAARAALEVLPDSPSLPPPRITEKKVAPKAKPPPLPRAVLTAPVSAPALQLPPTQPRPGPISLVPIPLPVPFPAAAPAQLPPGSPSRTVSISEHSLPPTEHSLTGATTPPARLMRSASGAPSPLPQSKSMLSDLLAAMDAKAPLSPPSSLAAAARLAVIS